MAGTALRMSIVMLTPIRNTRDGPAIECVRRDILSCLDLLWPALDHPHPTMKDVSGFVHSNAITLSLTECSKSVRALGVEGNKLSVESIEFVENLNEAMLRARQTIERPSQDYLKPATAGVAHEPVSSRPCHVGISDATIDIFFDN